MRDRFSGARSSFDQDVFLVRQRIVYRANDFDLRLARFVSGELLRKEPGRPEDLVDVVGHFGRMPVSIPAFVILDRANSGNPAVCYTRSGQVHFLRASMDSDATNSNSVG